MYLTITRPDLCYSVHVLSQVMHEPRDAHWDAAMRVLKYLKGSPGQGIMLRSDSDLQIRAFVILTRIHVGVQGILSQRIWYY